MFDPGAAGYPGEPDKCVHKRFGYLGRASWSEEQRQVSHVSSKVWISFQDEVETREGTWIPIHCVDHDRSE